MDKRYQVFVSSTYTDLKEERQQVFQTLMKMNCIPAGMEQFPAADEKQLEFIKKVIDVSDYYLLIIGGRYGSMDASGISYTEQEFDYAVESGLHVLAFVHDSPEDIPLSKSEGDPALREKLLSFKNKAKKERVVEHWKTPGELSALVAVSLKNAIETHPGTGWVRANNAVSGGVSADIKELKKQNAELTEQNAALQAKISELQQAPIVEGMADIDSTVAVHGSYGYLYTGEDVHPFECQITWRELFGLISPYFAEKPFDAKVKKIVAASLKEFATGSDDEVWSSINDQDFRTILVQLEQYGLVEPEQKTTPKDVVVTYWSLTPKGHQLMIAERVVKK